MYVYAFYYSMYSLPTFEFGKIFEMFLKEVLCSPMLDCIITVKTVIW